MLESLILAKFDKIFEYLDELKNDAKTLPLYEHIVNEAININMAEKEREYVSWCNNLNDTKLEYLYGFVSKVGDAKKKNKKKKNKKSKKNKNIYQYLDKNMFEDTDNEMDEDIGCIPSSRPRSQRIARNHNKPLLDRHRLDDWHEFLQLSDKEESVECSEYEP